VKIIIKTCKTAEQYAEDLAEAFIALANAGVDFMSDHVDCNEIYVDHKYRKEFYKLDLTRPKIQHQILCRKPRNQIKKVIH